jgi:hypothetical protein
METRVEGRGCGGHTVMINGGVRPELRLHQRALVASHWARRFQQRQGQCMSPSATWAASSISWLCRCHALLRCRVYASWPGLCRCSPQLMSCSWGAQGKQTRQCTSPVAIFEPSHFGIQPDMSISTGGFRWFLSAHSHRDQFPVSKSSMATERSLECRGQDTNRDPSPWFKFPLGTCSRINNAYAWVNECISNSGALGGCRCRNMKPRVPGRA